MLIVGQGIDHYNFDVFLDSRDFHPITAMDAMTHIFPFPLPIPEFGYLQKRALFALILSLLFILYEAVINTYVWMYVPKGIVTLIWDQKRSQKNRSHVNNKIIPCALSLFFSQMFDYIHGIVDFNQAFASLRTHSGHFVWKIPLPHYLLSASLLAAGVLRHKPQRIKSTLEC